MSLGHSFSENIALWKWILLLIGGFFLFLILTGIAQIAGPMETGPLMKAALYLVGSIFVLGAYKLIVGKVERRGTDELALSEATSWTAKGLLAGFGYFIVITAILAVAGMYRIGEIDFNINRILEYFFLYLAVAVGEELTFRGIVFRMIAERWNIVTALIVSSLLFGFMHIFQEDATVWSSVAIAIEAGLLLGAAYAVSGNLWFPIGIHWAWNFMEGTVFGFDVSGAPTTYKIIDPVINGPEIITGGGFGPEASILAVILGAGLSIWFLIIASKGKN